MNEPEEKGLYCIMLVNSKREDRMKILDNIYIGNLDSTERSLVL